MIENCLDSNMPSDWLEEAVAEYNDESYNRREEYVAQVHFPVTILEEILGWAFKSLPDEILVGLDVKNERIDPEIAVMYQGEKHKENLFAGQGYKISEAKMLMDITNFDSATQNIKKMVDNLKNYIILHSE